MAHTMLLTVANALANMSIVMTETPRERALIRTIAGAQRRLDEDLNMSPLQAIDRLQKLNVKFRDQWIDAPWLVLADCFCLPAAMPVAKMLEEISTHGEPIGIVGMALLKTTQRYAVLKMMFRKDDKNRKTVEKSATAATDVLLERIRRVRNLYERDKNDA